MFEAVGCEKGTFESKEGDDPVEEVEADISIDLLPCCLLNENETRNFMMLTLTTIKDGAGGSAAVLTLFLGVSMPKARCDSLRAVRNIWDVLPGLRQSSTQFYSRAPSSGNLISA